MTAEELEEKFEGDFADTCAKQITTHVYVGTSNTINCEQLGSENRHRCERKFVLVIITE